jgi:hypothetical protein
LVGCVPESVAPSKDEPGYEETYNEEGSDSASNDSDDVGPVGWFDGEEIGAAEGDVVDDEPGGKLELRREAVRG